MEAKHQVDKNRNLSRQTTTR